MRVVTLLVVCRHVRVFMEVSRQSSIARLQSGVLVTCIEWGTMVLRYLVGKRPCILLVIRDVRPACLLNTARSIAASCRLLPRCFPIRLTACRSRAIFLSVQHLYRTGTTTLRVVMSVPSASNFSDGG